MNKSDQREFWRIFGCFAVIISVFFFSVFGLSLLSEKKWNEGLKKSIQSVISEKYPDTWIIGNPVPLKSTFSTSANLYELRNRDNAERYYAIIIRIPTMYGHMPAVYIYNKNDGAEFAGYAAVHGRVQKLLEENKADSSVNFWLERIPAIIAKAEEVTSK